MHRTTIKKGGGLEAAPALGHVVPFSPGAKANNHVGPGCGKEIEVTVPTRFSCKLVTTTCGSTGIYGYPEFCDECEPKYADRDWRRESEAAGENFDSDY